MGESKIGGANNTSSHLETEGLSGIDLRVENHNLKIDGFPSPFSGGKGTQNEPFKTMGLMDLSVTLANTRWILEKIKGGSGPERTVFFTFNGRLLGSDSTGHVQLIVDKESSAEERERDTRFIKEQLDNLMEDDKRRKGYSGTKWTLSIVDKE